jgi:hypothetical protein
VASDDFRADEQSKSGAWNRAGASRAIARFEDARSFIGRNADAMITDRYPRRICDDPQLDLDVTTVR